MDNNYFASLGFTDLTRASNLCEQVSAAEINFYRLLGMALTILVGYARYPSRCARTFRHLWRGDSESAFEKRLNLLLRRPLVRFVRRLLRRPETSPNPIRWVAPASVPVWRAQRANRGKL